jgi:hypothetical protein
VAVEFQIITSREFFRLGAHGELDWAKSMEVLTVMVKGFVERGTDLALVDVRDTKTDLSDLQVEALVTVLKKVGLRHHHRVAILHKPLLHSKAKLFAEAASDRGFDIADFTSYEKAAEWLSHSGEEDPDFDRETYHGQTGQARPDAAPPPPSPESPS